MGELHHIYVRYDDINKQSGGGQASILQRHLGSDVMTRICSETKKKYALSFYHRELLHLHSQCACDK